jgi:short-subunit dehydrogenase
MSGLLDRYGPWALVTGASGGIGEAFARALAAEGFALVLVARREARLQALAAELAARHGTIVRILAVDLATQGGTQAAIEAGQAVDLGLLVAAAGFGSSGSFLATSVAEETAMLELNCRAVLALTHRFAQSFATRGRGGIVLLSSVVAFQGVPQAAQYAATKAWVQSLAEGIAPELQARGVDVVAAVPGPVRSGFAARARMTFGATDRPEGVARRTLAALGRRVTVRPGPLSMLLGLSLSALPRGLRSRVLGRAMAQMAGGPHRG